MVLIALLRTSEPLEGNAAHLSASLLRDQLQAVPRWITPLLLRLVPRSVLLQHSPSPQRLPELRRAQPRLLPVLVELLKMQPLLLSLLVCFFLP
jgi:hypothetical protein